MQDGNPYDQVLKDLYAKRDEIDQMIKSLERFMGSLGHISESQGSSIREGQIFERLLGRVRPGEFHGLSYPAAAKKILLMTDKHALKTEQLVDIIEKSGRKMEAKNPASTLFSSLARNSDFTKVAENTWGLTEWYGNATRPKKVKKEPEIDTTNDGTEPISEEVYELREEPDLQ